MATATQVLEMLLPEGGWSVLGNDWDGVKFIEATPITKAQFEAGFAQYDAWEAEQENAKQAAKILAQSKLEALGLTTDD